MEQQAKQIENGTSTESLEQVEKKLNEILPILAHGLVKRLGQKGLAGKVKISSIAGNDWGVTKSSDNPSDVPNVIVYPRDYLNKENNLVNARLRHEVGNLNYPISEEINKLRGWCAERNIPPELLTSLTESVQEASVNYLEMQNSYSDKPEENFRALYENEINTAEVARNIGQNPPYKQAVDLSLLYSLNHTGIIPDEQFRQAYDNCSQSVRDVFTKQTTSLLDQIVKTSNSGKKVQLVKDHLWPILSKLVEQPKPNDEKSEQEQKPQDRKDNSTQDPKESDKEGKEDEGQKNPSKDGKEDSGKRGADSNKQENEGKSGEDQKNSEPEQTSGSEDQQTTGEPSEEQLKQIKRQLDKIDKPASDSNVQDSEGSESGETDSEHTNDKKNSGQQGAGVEGGEEGQPDTEQGVPSKSEIKKLIEQKIKELEKKGDNDSKEKIKELQKLEKQLEDLNKGEKVDENSLDSEKEFTPGGQSREQTLRDLFNKGNPGLLDQLKQTEDLVGSKFSTKDKKGETVEKKPDIKADEILQQQDAEETKEIISKQLKALDEIKRQQQNKLESVYRELSGLEGEALKTYTEYRESMRDFISDLVDFFAEKFKLDKEFLYEKHQRRGARLEKGFTRNILGEKEGRVIVDLASLERKKPPQKPQINWSLVIDNSGSCSGEVIEQEKRLAVALIEVATTLDIPLEILTFGREEDKDGNDVEYVFLKSFEQEMYGDDLQKIVLLEADQGTPDVATLEAACSSAETFMDKFKRSNNFVYFMTDGQSGDGSIKDVIKKYRNNLVIIGVGLAGAAGSIATTWGKNALAVPDTAKLPGLFIRKMEQQIDQAFD